MAFVKPEKPHEIHIRAALVESATEAGLRRQRNPIAYDCAVFVMSVTIAHELLHSMRDQILSAAKNTPPSIDDGMHPGRLVRGQDEKLYRVGESGWWWERMVFGGSAAEVVHVPGETGWTYPFKMKRILLDGLDLGEQPIWFRIAASVIRDVVRGREGWEALIPFHPSSRFPSHSGRNREPRISDFTPSPPRTASDVVAALGDLRLDPFADPLADGRVRQQIMMASSPPSSRISSPAPRDPDHPLPLYQGARSLSDSRRRVGRNTS